MIRNIPGWILIACIVLAFSAGYINSIALLSFNHQAVSHVTGTLTITASAASQRAGAELWSGGALLISFFIGAIASGIIIGNEALKKGRRYGVALTLESLCLLLAWWLFREGHIAGEWLASAACGLQNAMVATYSGSVIRTTHMTGILSDIGSAVGNLLARRQVLKPQLRLQLGILASFFAGGIAGAWLFSVVSVDALLLPACWVFVLAVIYQLSLRRFSGSSR